MHIETQKRREYLSQLALAVITAVGVLYGLGTYHLKGQRKISDFPIIKLYPIISLSCLTCFAGIQHLHIQRLIELIFGAFLIQAADEKKDSTHVNGGTPLPHSPLPHDARTFSESFKIRNLARL